MRLVFTEHARLRLLERKIDVQEVENVIMKPEWKFYDLKNRYNVAIGKRKKEGHYLIVVYGFSQEFVEVITVIDTSKRLEKIIKTRMKSRKWVKL
ncbi:DUF4258 domain-containing protein [Archaeoglobales archaeon]|nr:MAG: DUF4258 domain-containing protein [Archaeoglobales archaeon]